MAAPTAGLHFTPELLARVRDMGVEIVTVTLHVGYGTFKPVRVEVIEDHVVDPERYAVSRSDGPPLRQTREPWVEALPIGNGRLGAMVFGGVAEERIQFNESTLWTGQPHDYANEGASAFLQQMRDLLNEGRRLGLDAEALAAKGQTAEAEAKRKAAKDKQAQAEDIGTREFMSEPIPPEDLPGVRRPAPQLPGARAPTARMGGPGSRRGLDLDRGEVFATVLFNTVQLRHAVLRQLSGQGDRLPHLHRVGRAR